MLKDLSLWPRGKRATFGERLHAAATHLLLCLVVAGMAFGLVHWVWYPNEYWEMSGGRELFFLLVSVDVVLGPLITLAIFNPGKGWGRMKFDLAVVLVLQAAALAYGLWTVASVRPAYLVHTGDRFNVVSAMSIEKSELALAAQPAFRKVPWLGPEIVGTRAPSTPEESNQLLMDGLAGKDIEVQPKFYLPYKEVKQRVLAQSRTLQALRMKNPETAWVALDEKLKALGREEQTLRWLPVMARGDWVALIDAESAEPLAFLPLNGF
jgi:hypothetical protein